MPRKLLAGQQRVLDHLRKEGSWTRDSGWVNWNPSTTTSVLENLTKLGLAIRTTAPDGKTIYTPAPWTSS